MKVFIKNCTNQKLFIQNNKKEVFCKLDPKDCSFEAYEDTELKYSPYVQILLSKGYIRLVEDRVEEPKPIYKNYGQKFLVGSQCELKGDHHVEVTVVQYIPQNGQYKVQLDLTGGIMTVTERELQPRVKNEKKEDNVDIVVNDGSSEVPLDAKNVKDIMTDAYNAIENMEQDETEIITIGEQPLPQEEDNGTFIVRNNDINEKFAREIPIQKVVQDTVTQTNEILKNTAKEIKANKEFTEELKTVDFSQIPENLRVWFNDFLGKEERKQKMVIARLNDIEKLTVIKTWCKENIAKMAENKINNLQNKNIAK